MTTRFRSLSAFLALLAILLAFAATPAAADPAHPDQPLVADLSKHLVAITTGFSGTDVLMFGAVEREPGGGGDIVMVVRGPSHSQVVRRKDRQGGIWIKVGRAVIDNAPSFYRVAATRPLADIAPAALLDQHQIGVDHLALVVHDTDAATPPASYRAALQRLEQRDGLWGKTVQTVDFLSHRLFRTEVHFPANVPVGTYRVEVYLLDHGQVVSTQTTPLVISKIGLGADIFDFAHESAALYGIIAIVLAGATGWLAAVAFKKG